MSARRAPRTASLSSLLLLALAASRCTCGDEADVEPTGVSARAAELYRMLFADLPKADVEHPAAAVPSDLEWVAASPDAEAWRAWAVAQPYVKTWMQTPLFADLRLSKAWRALDGLQRRSAQAARLTGASVDRAALWAGPTALALSAPSGSGRDAPRHVLLVKAIRPGEEALIRFAAAFGALGRAQDTGGTLERRKIDDAELLVWSEPGRTIAFALFRDLLIAGDDPALVERAVGLAAGAPITDGDAGSLDRLPDPKTPGVHLSLRFAGESAPALLGLDDLGVSLVADPKAPVVLRRRRAEAAGEDSLGLLRYAPESSFFAMVDGGKPSGALLSRVKARLSGQTKVGDVDLEAQLARQLGGGMGLAFTRAPDAGAFGGLALFAHDSPDLEPAVRKLLGEMSSSDITRTKLDGQVKGTLLGPQAGGLHAAITKDALLLAMSEDTLRAALAAGQAQAPSLKDRRLDLSSGAPGAVYLDLGAGADFLGAFAAEHAAEEDAKDVLQPTLDAMRAGGRLFARLEPRGGSREEGALHAVP